MSSWEMTCTGRIAQSLGTGFEFFKISGTGFDLNIGWQGTFLLRKVFSGQEANERHPARYCAFSRENTFLCMLIERQVF
jgi:hypothetical protein